MTSTNYILEIIYFCLQMFNTTVINSLSLLVIFNKLIRNMNEYFTSSSSV